MTELNDMVNVRYMVDDVDAAIAFYTKHLGFEVHTDVAPAFADVTRGQLRLLLSGPTSSAGRPMPDLRGTEVCRRMKRDGFSPTPWCSLIMPPFSSAALTATFQMRL